MGSCIGNKPRPKDNPVTIPKKLNIIEYNAKLDRLGSAQLNLLKLKFKEVQTDSGIDLKGFRKLLPLLKEFPEEIVVSSFKVFDSDSSGYISWYNLCVTVSQYIVGHRDEKCKFLFKVFDLKNSEKLDTEEIKLLQRYCENFIRENDQFPKNSESVLDICINQKKQLSFEEFKNWALENLELHLVLQPFEIIPSPVSEREIIRTLLAESEKTGRKEGDIWNVISGNWFDAWKRYVNFTGEEQKDPEIERAASLRMIRSRSVVQGSRPIEIDNRELQDPNCELKLFDGLIAGDHFELIPNSAWKELLSWYGGGPEFSRETILHNGNLEIELYPQVFKIIVKKAGQSINKKPTFILISKKKKISDVLETFKGKYADDIMNLLLVDGDSRELLDPQWVIEDISFPNISQCILELGDIRNSSFFAEKEERGDAFLEGDPVEYYDHGYWMPGTLTEIKDEEFVIGGGWMKKSISIPLYEKYRLRKPNRIQIDNKTLKGATGLVNIGNTCFMNSILQPISNTPLLNHFFSSEAHIKHINHDNPDGSKGKISYELQNVLQELWNGSQPSYRPNSFLNIFSQIHSQFRGYEQHDSHEFLRILLDSLHEDLNRRVENIERHQILSLSNPSPQEEKKASQEQWELLQGSRGSVISDLCGGQTRNVLKCEKCNDITTLFEMFMDLSIPLPNEQSELSIRITVILRPPNPIVRYILKLKKNCEISDLFEKLNTLTGVSPQNFLFAHVNHSYADDLFYPKNIMDCILNDESDLYAFEVIDDIEQAEMAGKLTLKRENVEGWRKLLKKGQQIDVNSAEYGWIEGQIADIRGIQVEIHLNTEIPSTVCLSKFDESLAPLRTHTKNDNKIIHLLITHSRKGLLSYEFFGIPQVLSIGNWYTWKDLNNQLDLLCKEVTIKTYYTSKTTPSNLSFFLLKNSDMKCALCTKEKCQGCECPRNNDTLKWIEKNQKSVFVCIFWRNPGLYKYVIIKEIEDLAVFSIDQCLEKFTQTETLEAKCEKCSHDKKQSQIEIWRVPDILIVHLKRFSFDGNGFKKLSNLVTFPLTYLDLSSIMANTENKTGITISTTKENYMYDLFAVVNHSGSVEGGHYTCFCLNAENEKRWLYYDDNLVFEVTGDVENEIITSKAYILFYRRQRFASSNVVNLSAIETNKA
ncbi:unnamed protein product [Blepharisma stoltei]|uniref:Ubiquitinyl hydrolase 1 n=1 Tax=Blepharisma stoltei TaxID=1481888 RepID=A0AAU9K3W6_9CILI|nr:unnamed protein product [Blepharisma stoltei]